MTTIDTVVIGAGHAGPGRQPPAHRAGRDHVVLDRGRVGERWRTERWDSLHLLTPNWMTRLPGWATPGPTRTAISAPGSSSTTSSGTPPRSAPPSQCTTVERVTAVRRPGTRYYASSPTAAPGTPATWWSPPVRTDTPYVPAGLAGVAPDVEVVTPANRYRNPASSADGGVLVVGASSSGVQIADELVGPAARWSWRSAGTPGCRAATAAWTSSGGWRPPAGWPGPSTRCPTRRGATRAVAAAGRPQRPRHASPGPRPRRACRQGVRLAGPARRGRGSPSVRRRPGRHRRGGRRHAAPLPRRGRRLRRARGLAREVLPQSGVPAGRRSPRPTRLDLRAEGIGTVLLAAGYRPDTLAAAADHRRRTGASGSTAASPGAGRLRRRSALPAPPRLRLHRRRPPRRAPWSPTCSAQAIRPARSRRPDRRGPRHEPLRRRRGRRPGGRRVDRDAAGPRRARVAAGGPRPPAPTPCPRTP